MMNILNFNSNAKITVRVAIITETQPKFISRSMFTLRNLFQKGPKFNSSRALLSTQQSNYSKSSQEEMRYHLALNITKYFKTILSPIDPDTLSKIKNVHQNSWYIQKMHDFALSVPNPFLAKKLFQICFEKSQTSFPKEKVKQTLQYSYDENLLNKFFYQIPTEKTSTNGVYEFLATVLLSRQLTLIRKIRFNSEDPRIVDESTQKTNKILTGQANCDLEATLKHEEEDEITTLYDILVGQNSHHKGNAIQLEMDNVVEAQKYLNKLLIDINSTVEKIEFSEKDQKTILLLREQISSLYKENTTMQNKVTCIQTKIIQSLIIIKKYKFDYNPNLIFFLPAEKGEMEALQKTASEISSVLHEHSKNDAHFEALKKAFPIYVKNYGIDWKSLSSFEKEKVLPLIKKLSPAYFLEIMQKGT